MINELLNEIKIAEANAETMAEIALEEAKAMVASAEKTALEMRAKAKTDAKAERLAVTESTEKEAEANYNNILAMGQKEADKLKQTIDISKTCEKVAEAFIKRWAQ